MADSCSVVQLVDVILVKAYESQDCAIW